MLANPARPPLAVLIDLRVWENPDFFFPQGVDSSSWIYPHAQAKECNTDILVRHHGSVTEV
jgi:hypothetical protein